VSKWQRTQIAAALKNSGVRIGERALKDGTKLRGLYALQSFDPGDYVASFHGKHYSLDDLRQLHAKDRPLFDRITEYGVGNPQDGMTYPEDLDTLGAHLINHSCGPSTKWGQEVDGATLIRAVKRIEAGDEITIFYGWLGLKAAMEGKRHRCACAARYCAGHIELYVQMVREGQFEGPWLSYEEVARRFLADMANGTKEHEGLLIRYAKNPTAMIVDGGQVVEELDRAAYFDKLRSGAGMALAVLRRVQRAGCALGAESEARVREVVETYKLPEGGLAPPPQMRGTET
jgi:hypothetical protein